MINSIITPRAQIDENNWCVTLVCGKNKGIRGCHAKLIFETYSKKYSAKIAELTVREGVFKNYFTNSLVGFTEFRKLDRDEFKNNFNKKTATWIVTKDRICGLIKKIKDDSDKEYPFRIYGGNSIFSSTVETYDIKDILLAELEICDKDLFLRLQDSAENEGKCTGMTLDEFEKSIDSAVELMKLKINDIKDKDEKECGKPLSKKENEFLCFLEKEFEKGLKYDYKFFINLISKNKISRNDLHQHNCFTWARSHLRSIGIELEESKLSTVGSKIFSVSEIYIRYPAQGDGEVINLTGRISSVECKTEECTSSKETSIYRHVTYKSKRDKRTETWKRIEREAKKADYYTKASSIVFAPAPLIGALAWGEIISTVVAGTATLTAVSSFVAGVGIISAPFVVGSMVLSNISEKKLEKLKLEKDEVKRTVTESEFAKYERSVFKGDPKDVSAMEDLELEKAV